MAGYSQTPLARKLVFQPGQRVWASAMPQTVRYEIQKRAARMVGEASEEEVRRAALPLGLVDIEVGAVDQTWSGLKRVVRRALRGETGAGATPRPVERSPSTPKG